MAGGPASCLGVGSEGLRVPARNALLADLVPQAVYGRAYGFERAMDNLLSVARFWPSASSQQSASDGRSPCRSFPASAIAGGLWSAISPMAAFICLAAASATAVPLILTSRRSDHIPC